MGHDYRQFNRWSYALILHHEHSVMLQDASCSWNMYLLTEEPMVSADE